MDEMFHHHESDLSGTEIDHLDEESDDIPEPATVRTPTKKNNKSKKNLLPKIAWSVIGLLVLRLICMDRGVWDYFATEGEIREKKYELNSIQQENKSLKNEITRIQLDRNYQRQLAKEHLGDSLDEILIF